VSPWSILGHTPTRASERSQQRFDPCSLSDGEAIGVWVARTAELGSTAIMPLMVGTEQVRVYARSFLYVYGIGVL